MPARKALGFIPVFDAILIERSIFRAAMRLGIAQQRCAKRIDTLLPELVNFLIPADNL